MQLDLDSVDHLLSTTRAVRKRLDLDREVPADVIEECLRLAVQAPSGSNSQGWRWLVVTDAEKRAALSELYRRSWDAYVMMRAAEAGDREPSPTMTRVAASATFLADNLHRVPVHVIPCIYETGRPQEAGLWGSIFPAVWSFQLALRSRGLGSSLTTLHLVYAQEAAELLGIPEGVKQAALLPVAYSTGDDFRPADRRPVRDITYWDAWKQMRA